MPLRLSGNTRIASGLTKRGGPENEESDHKQVSVLYYDLATDFYEYGWGRSFDFAPRVPGESFKASLTRHERYLADKLELKPGMVAADLGCGVAGPLLEIAVTPEPVPSA